jgi:hypothetical protein
MKRILVLALLLLATIPVWADDLQPQTARGSIGSATGVAITPSGKFSYAEIWLGKDATANLTWVIWRQTCVDCDSEQIATGTNADLPVTYGGRSGYSYSIAVTTYVAGTLYYRVRSQ